MNLDEESLLASIAFFPHEAFLRVFEVKHCVGCVMCFFSQLSVGAALDTRELVHQVVTLLIFFIQNIE